MPSPQWISSLLVVSSFIFNVSEAVKCFCDRSSCEESLICNSEYCIIGLRRDDSDASENAKLRQLCGSGEVSISNIDRCDQREDGWQEVCYCKEEFCNTFAFLRQSMDTHSEPRFHSSHSFSDSNAFFSSPDHAYPPPSVQDPGGRHQRSSLIVLLVIIPLSVGGLAVCLIFLNYHCKMC